MPLGLDQRVGARRLEPARLGPPDRQDPPRASRRRRAARRAARGAAGPPSRTSILFTASSTRSTRSRRRPGRPSPQVALNWLLQRPTVSSVIIGARNEEQLRENLGAVGWKLTADQVATLDRASARRWPTRTGTRSDPHRAQSTAGLTPPGQPKRNRASPTARGHSNEDRRAVLCGMLPSSCEGNVESRLLNTLCARPNTSCARPNTSCA